MPFTAFWRIIIFAGTDVFVLTFIAVCVEELVTTVT